MGKAVNKTEFWKERIDTAAKDHFSVYVTSEGDWKYIEQEHRKILNGIEGKVLDAGCGYGRSSEWFDNYVGIDFSPDFIEMARQKYPNKEFVQADLADLPFKDNEFDVAFCISIKEMIVDNLGEDAWMAMEKELKRVAKKVLILEYTNPDKYFEL